MQAADFVDKQGHNPLVEMVEQISIDGKTTLATRKADRKKLIEAKKAEMNRDPDELPDAPEMVLAGQGTGLVDDTDDEAEVPVRPGLSGPGSYEMAMRMFGPPRQPHPDVAKVVGE